MFGIGCGKIYDWNYSLKTDHQNITEVSDDLKEINAEIDGKQLSKLQIKDIASSQNHLFLATGKDSFSNDKNRKW
jgi:hypothetical protein